LIEEKRSLVVAAFFHFGVCIFENPVLQANDLNEKVTFIMCNKAVTRATYFGFYFYFSRGAPVIC
jgi:hypothetical protein